VLLFVLGFIFVSAVQEGTQSTVVDDLLTLHSETPKLALANSYHNPSIIRHEPVQRNLPRSLAHLLDFTTPVIKRANTERSCFPFNTPEVQANLETCCWYNSATCCSPQIAAAIIPSIKGNLSQLQQEIGLGDDCYFAVADLICMICAPNTADWVIKKVSSDSKPSIQLHICDSLCNKMYSACKNDLSKIPGMKEVNNGEQFCAELFKEAHQSGNIVFDPKEEKSCYDGVPLDQVEQAYCLPHQTKPSNDDGTYLAFIIVPIALAVVLLLAIGAGVAGFLWYKKRRNQEKVQVDIALAGFE